MLAKNVLNLKDFEDHRLTESRLGVSPSPILHTPRSQTESPCSDVESSKVLSKRDLIKAVTALKKVIARLRAEKENFVHKDYVEQLRKELRKMEENYLDAVERGLSLEEQLRDKLNCQTYVGKSDMSINFISKCGISERRELLEIWRVVHAPQLV